MLLILSHCNNILDISKWNTSNVTNMNGMFSHCNNIPDISKWNISNINNFNLSNLKSGIIYNIFFHLITGRKIFIQAYEYMTFSNVVKIFYIKAGISNLAKLAFVHCSDQIDPNSNKFINELSITYSIQIFVHDYHYLY